MQSLFKSAQICFHPICASVWGLFDRASSSWNNVKCQLDATRWYYWCILSSTCFGRIRRLSGALDVELQHMVFWTEFLKGWCFESRCVGRVYGADGARHGTIHTVNIKAKLILDWNSVKIFRRFMLCDGVAACHWYGVCIVRCVECELRVALNTPHSKRTNDMLPHHRTT